MPQMESDTESMPSKLDPSQFSTTNSTTFVKRKHDFVPIKEYKLQNSLLVGVGLLELANAGDFAANVWNEIPVPTFAAVLMGLGGTFALALSVFAAIDAVLSWRNVVLLKQERAFLRKQRAALVSSTTRDLETHLDVNHRELGTEMIDRLGMDIFMGFGAVMVGTGTLMAIGGANPKVYQASNLLSGYIGNAPVALYGLFNAWWSIYVWRRANRHRYAGLGELKGDEVLPLLIRRTRRVKAHAVMIGISGIVAGGASLTTAKFWYGYPLLVPCIIMSAICNYMWRTRIGYDRQLLQRRPQIDKASLVQELQIHIFLRKLVKHPPPDLLHQIVPDADSMASILEFLVSHDLFTDFCARLLKDSPLVIAALGPLAGEIEITSQRLLDANSACYPRFVQIAETTIIEMGDIRFKYRERYLLETLGCFLTYSEFTIPKARPKHG
ncbi:hypothetical protein BGZ60DRAFT_364601 [Tricladium varicosporioides]|nr:hypothetical protein BGZ60DRAFT_364601 [Hymenoscyphus varicosporioides]